MGICKLHNISFVKTAFNCKGVCTTSEKVLKYKWLNENNHTNGILYKKELLYKTDTVVKVATQI